MWKKVNWQSTTQPCPSMLCEPNFLTVAFLSLGASKDEGLALALAAVNGATV